MAAQQQGFKNLQLPNPTTEANSMKFVQRLTGAIISHIAYNRNLFEDDDFVPVTFGGISIKMVEGSTSPGARSLYHWLTGVFKALQLKYVKSITLEIRDSLEQPIETYSLEYTYLENSIQCSMSASASGLVCADIPLPDSIRKQVSGVLRNLLTLLSSGEDLPETCSTAMLITYNNAAPIDYDPPGFKPLHRDEVKHKAKKFNCGKVSTNFHEMVLKTRFYQRSSESSNITCLCGKTDSNSNLLKCIKCGNIQHAACYKMFTVDNLSQEEHTCFKCVGGGETIDNSAEECIYRRALVLCAKTKSISVQKVMQELGLDVHTAIVNMRRLLREEALSKNTQPFSPEKLDFPYGVNQKNIINNLKIKYFTEK